MTGLRRRALPFGKAVTAVVFCDKVTDPATDPVLENAQPP
jgi:hypothetical protein